MNRKIIVDEITRVEGYGSIEVELGDGRVKGVKMNISEGPRFFESLVKTVSYEKVPDIMRRICAICTASHTLASIMAIEKAFDVEVTSQTRLLRDLLINGEMIESHALHVFLLAMPDVLGYPDVVEMATKYADAVKMALHLKRTGNMIHIALGGREVHGMNERVGGFAKVPAEAELRTIRENLVKARPAAELAVKLFADAEPPAYVKSANNMMALDSDEAFGFTGDHVLTSLDGRHPVEDYLSLTNERTIKHSHAKFSYYNDAPFMVGSLPRVLLNGRKLQGEAAEFYRENREKLNPENSLLNNLAQAIELIYSVDRSIETIDHIVAAGVEDEELAEFEVFSSRGVGAVEAPRGILYHDYAFDEEGRVTKANVITPTAQNAANMEKDYRVAAERLIAEPDEKIRQSLEVITRAYDPCISCSVHLVRVKV